MHGRAGDRDGFEVVGGALVPGSAHGRALLLELGELGRVADRDAFEAVGVRWSQARRIGGALVPELGECGRDAYGAASMRSSTRRDAN